MHSSRRVAAATIAAAATGIAVFLPVHSALSAAGSPVPAVSSELPVGSLRPPPGADGVAPPEAPEVQAHIDQVEAFYRLTEAEAARARTILAGDPTFQKLLGGASYDVVATSSWKDADATAPKGAGFDLVLRAPLTTSSVTIPALGEVRGLLTPQSYLGALVSVTKLSVIVSFDDNRVVDVVPETSGPAKVLYFTSVPTIETED